MKLFKNKKLMISLSVLTGLLLIMATAFADSVNGSAYELLKTSIKYTSIEMDRSIKSSTTNVDLVIKDNDKIIYSLTSSSKINRTDQMSEYTENIEYRDGKSFERYSFVSPSIGVALNSYSDTYYLTKRSKDPRENRYDSVTNTTKNIFETEHIEDIEKIFDALIGNMTNYVDVSYDSDGLMTFEVSLIDAQIPALINAIASYACKQYFSMVDGNIAIPEMSEDISVRSAVGKAEVSAEGVMDHVFVSGVLTGKDKYGKVHDLAAEVLITIEDIDSTVLKEPDLTGKNVTISENVPRNPSNYLSSKYIGAYLNNIYIETTDGPFKIGERVLVLSEISAGLVKGSFSETYFEGYEDRYSDLSEYDFEGFSGGEYSFDYNITDTMANEWTVEIRFEAGSYDLRFDINNHEYPSNLLFTRIFD